jgi:UPF0176 protein
LPLERQEAIRKGIDKGQNIFNKSLARLRPKLNEMIQNNEVKIKP